MKFDFKGTTIDQTEDWKNLDAAFSSLRNWASAVANDRSPKRATRLAGPLWLPELPSIRQFPKPSIQHADLTRDGMYAVRLRGMPTDEPRVFPPAFFAILRTMELAPGASIRLEDETDWKRPDAATYRIVLNVLPIEGCKRIKTPLARILFDVPENAELHERRTRDHRVIAPENFVMTKYRPKRDPQTRTHVLASLRCHVRSTAGFLPYGPDDLAGLLASLFETADRWHWYELLDRMEDEKPKPWGAPYIRLSGSVSV